MADKSYKFNFNKTVIAKLRDYSANVFFRANTTNVVLVNTYSFDYNSTSIILQRFMDGLPIYKFSELGIDAGNLNVAFSSSISSNYFMANANVEHILCYCPDRGNIGTSVWVKNFPT